MALMMSQCCFSRSDILDNVPTEGGSGVSLLERCVEVISPADDASGADMSKNSFLSKNLQPLDSLGSNLVRLPISSVKLQRSGREKHAGESCGTKHSRSLLTNKRRMVKDILSIRRYGQCKKFVSIYAQILHIRSWPWQNVRPDKCERRYDGLLVLIL